RNAYAIHNVLAVRPELPFFVVRWDGERRLEWMDLSDPRQRLKPFHFEIYFGKEALRDQHYLEALARAGHRKQVGLKPPFGFWDLFYRIATEGAQHIFLYVGQFYREPPDWATISAQWRELTGQAPASANPDFVHFVRMALGLPVLEPSLLEAVGKFVELEG